ncbi:MAG: TlyA family rRNA (cytidine-2'-O)-methyltransferase [Proteobacteria bacterium]|nr:MAG: TlyA family rRNA (cytidine-2'-O)-methyltransferase [Pseudomonadota bacterium]
MAGFLGEFHLSVKNKICLDIGSSTGGFVQVLLENGAKKVVAVDVGSGQLHANLRDDEKIELHEQTDIRDFTSKDRFDLITCDVSFIAFKDVVDSIDKLANDEIIILFKPQFEVGKEAKRDKKGVVCDKRAIQKAREDFEKIATQKGWKLLSKKPSKFKGKQGNLESFYAFAKR